LYRKLVTMPPVRGGVRGERRVGVVTVVDLADVPEEALECFEAQTATTRTTFASASRSAGFRV
jgi:hypothetical protein